MHPVLITVNGHSLRSYSLILLLAVVVGILVLLRRGRQRGLPAQFLVGFGAGAIFFGLLGARLYEVILHWQHYAAQGDWYLRIWTEGGVGAPGGIAGVVLWTLVYARRFRLDRLEWLDLIAPVIPLVEGLARVGCLLAGCCYGRETTSAVGMYLPDLDGHWATRYPTQIAYCAGALVISAVLWALSRQRRRPGQLFSAFLMLYALDHALIDFWRADAAPMWGGLTAKQWLCAAAVLLGAAGWVWFGRRASAPAARPLAAPVVRASRRFLLVGAMALSLFVLGCGYRSIAIQVTDRGPVIVRLNLEVEAGSEPSEPMSCSGTEGGSSRELGSDSESCSAYDRIDAGMKGCECVLTYADAARFNAGFRLTTEVSGTVEVNLSANVQELPDRYRLTAQLKPDSLWARGDRSDPAKRDRGPMTLSVRMPGKIIQHSEPRGADLERVDVTGDEVRWQFTGATEGESATDEVYSVSVESRRAAASLYGLLPWALMGLAVVGGGVIVALLVFPRRWGSPLLSGKQHYPARKPTTMGPSRGSRSALQAEVQAPASGYPAIGETLGKYVIRELIGEGGMASVYRARHVTLGHNVALKVLAPHLARGPDFVERFNREGRILAALSHPNIVAIHDAGLDRSYYFLAMEFVDGESLDRRLQRKGPRPPGEVIWVGQKVTRALGYAHQRGLVHRDIKPANILISRDKQVKVADFGIAMWVQKGVTLFAGTPGYMPPEMLQGKADERSDIFSTGALLYHMLTGCRPAAQAGELLIPLERLVAGVPPALSQVVLRALQPDPRRRHQTAAEMQQELDRMGGAYRP